MKDIAQRCLTFIDRSVTCFHAVETMEEELKDAGFKELKEAEVWEIASGKGYFVKRNDSSLIAFRIPRGEIKGFSIVASHSDSPAFKVKAETEYSVENAYNKLNVEPYGGMIHATWLDRCLSVAGRVVYEEAGELKSQIVNIDEDLLVIPNVAIHMNREMNKSLSYNPQVDLQPVICALPEGKAEGEETNDKGKQTKSKDILMQKAAFYAGISQEQILGKDLFLYVREKGRLLGAQKEMMLAPRLDDLACVFASLQALLETQPQDYISVCAVFDNEEVGSLTRQGAASTFLKDVLERLNEALGYSRTDYKRFLSNSFMISADNAHAVHPNHPEKADPTNRPFLNQGIVIKYHGGQKYTTDAYSEAKMKSICKKAAVPVQTYCNRSDVPGGSTLGNISEGQVSLPCVDIGLPQLAMHSAVETAGSRDVEYMIAALKVFFES